MTVTFTIIVFIFRTWRRLLSPRRELRDCQFRFRSDYSHNSDSSPTILVSIIDRPTDSNKTNHKNYENHYSYYNLGCSKPRSGGSFSICLRVDQHRSICFRVALSVKTDCSKRVDFVWRLAVEANEFIIFVVETKSLFLWSEDWNSEQFLLTTPCVDLNEDYLDICISYCNLRNRVIEEINCEFIAIASHTSNLV